MSADKSSRVVPTVDEALAMIEQERLDELAALEPEDEFVEGAAYVLASEIRRLRAAAVRPECGSSDDTPETDAEAVSKPGPGEWIEMVTTDFAKGLERSRNVWRKQASVNEERRWALEQELAAVRSARPLLPMTRRWIDLFAKWEDSNGALAAIMPQEFEALMFDIITLAVHTSPRMARNELDATVPSTSGLTYEKAAYINSDCFIEWKVLPYNMKPGQWLYTVSATGRSE